MKIRESDGKFSPLLVVHVHLRAASIFAARTAAPRPPTPSPSSVLFPPPREFNESVHLFQRDMLEAVLFEEDRERALVGHMLLEARVVLDFTMRL